jgi:hypothetical protein
VSALIFADRPARSIAVHAIDRTTIIARTGQTELDLPNQRVGVSRIALVNRLIVRIVSVIERIIPVGTVVPVVWIRIVKERISKIVKEEKPILEVAMAETIAAKATAVKAAAKGAATKTTVTEAGATKAASTTEPAVTATTAARHHVRACKSANCNDNCNKFFVVHFVNSTSATRFLFHLLLRESLVDRISSLQKLARRAQREITFWEYNSANSV